MNFVEFLFLFSIIFNVTTEKYQNLANMYFSHIMFLVNNDSQNKRRVFHLALVRRKLKSDSGGYSTGSCPLE